MIVLDPEIEAKYEVLAKMGEGGMGSVYKVRHRVFGDIRVIKTGKFEDDDPAERDRFRSEAKRGFHFRHKSIARVTDFNITAAGTNYIEMEYIGGSNLRQLLAKSKSGLQAPQVIDISIQTLDALQYLHERGVVHRDISPENLMLTQDESGSPLVKLIDLGIAKSNEASQKFTKTGMFIGKFKYASPEQFRGEVEGPSDLYSLGIVMYELLTGVLPFRSTDPRAVYVAHITSDLRGFDDVDPEGRVPQNLRAVVRRALKRELTDRFQTATEFAESLRSLHSEEVIERTVEVPNPEQERAAVAASRSEQIAFDAAMASDSLKAWEDFLNRYPASARSGVARARQDDLEQVDQKDWDKAKAADTKDSWKRYLETHADSPRALPAQRRLEKIEEEEAERETWEAALKSDTITALESFIRNHPDGSHIEEARGRLAEKRAWAVAQRANGSADWQSFISQYPQSRHIEEAERNLATARYREKEARDFEDAAENGSIESWQFFLQVHSDSARRGEAEERLAVLRQKADEESAWSAAKSANTSKGWSAYLQRFRESPRAPEAERELKNAEARETEQLDWDVAVAIDTSYGWQIYLTKHPDGRAGMAQQRLAAANEAAAWTTAEQNGSSAAWRKFLGEFRASNRAAEAEELLAAAERKESSERDFEAAVQAGTAKAWSEFLALYDTTPFAANARLALDLARRKETEEEAFAEAERIDTIDIWTSFVERFPSSPRIDSALKQLARAQERLETQRRADEARLAAEEEAAWSQAASLHTIEGWQKYLADWSSSKRAAEARFRQADARAAAALDQAIKQDTIEALERFLKAYPHSDYAPKAQRKIDKIRAEERAKLDAEHRAWSGTNRDSIGELETFINNYPQSPRVVEARKLIDTIRKREADLLVAAEERAWRDAVRRNTILDYESFVNAYPASARVVDARKRVNDAITEEKRAWSVAEKRNTIAAYEKFIKSHPQSMRVADANRLIDSIRIAEVEYEWLTAEGVDTVARYEKFVRSYPEAKEVGEARRRIAQKREALDTASRERKEHIQARAAERVAAKALAAAEETRAREEAASRIQAAADAAERTRAEKEEISAATATRTSALFFSTPHRSRALTWVASVLIVTALSFGVYFRKDMHSRAQSTTKPRFEDIPTVTAMTQPTTSAPEIPVGTGQLVINALPWGEVKSLKDQATNTERIKAGQPLYTPATLNLPAGSYKVVLSNPNSGKSAPCSVIVKAAQTVKCEAIVDTVDPNEYLGALTVSGQ